MNHPDDGPFWEIAHEIEGIIGDGSTVFQRFTCEICRARQTLAEPNRLYKTASCQECGHITDLVRAGCGFMLVASTDPAAHAAFVDVMKESIDSSQPRNRN